MRGNLLLAVAILCLAASRAAAEEPLDLGFEELLDTEVGVPSAITLLRPPEVPAAVTVITAEDIRYTPARNLYDLIEVYVPGALWMMHEVGPHPGVRGNIANRNYRFLLVVNGRPMGSDAHYGAKAGLEQWDLSDIQRIEIVRGPGSVTYGPGAVAGVISITTYEAATAPSEVGVSARAVQKYDSLGVAGHWAHVGERLELYLAGSVTSTRGFAPRHFQVTSDGAGFVGDDVLPEEEPLHYFGDYQDDPQIGVHLDARFGDHWRAWFRYGQQGSHWFGNEVRSDFGDGPVDQKGLRDRQATATVAYDRPLGEETRVEALVSAQSTDAEARGEEVNHPDPDHALNKQIDFSESELFARVVLHWAPAAWVQVAAGGEYAFDRFGPGWGDSRRQLRLGESGELVSGTDSDAFDPMGEDHPQAFVGSGWSTHTGSLYVESQLAVTGWLKALLSARVDRHTHTDFLWSPRAALLARLGEHRYLKLVAQRSTRRNTAAQLWLEDQAGEPPIAETLDSVQLLFSAVPSARFTYAASAFLNRSDVVGWQGDDNVTTRIGELSVAGLELEAQHTWPTAMVGASYAYVKQLDWELADGLLSSGVSYSDYAQPLDDDGPIQTGVGNDLNNWPSHAVKVHGRVRLLDTLVLHGDARVTWDYQGAQDGLTGLERAVAGTELEAPAAADLERVDDVGAYEAGLRIDAALAYEPSTCWSFRLYAQNLVDATGNHRYSYDSGNDDPEPRRVRLVEEPFALWVVAAFRR